MLAAFDTVQRVGRRALPGGVLLAVALVVALVAVTHAAVSPYGSAAATRAIARRAAPALLAQLPTPPGATLSSTEPAGDKHVLRAPPFGAAALLSNVVDAKRWATTSMTPAQVIRYMRAHVPAFVRHAPVSTIVPSSGSDEAAVAWTLPATHGLDRRTAAVTAVALADGRTGVRVDGEAAWLVPRPGWERIPGTVTGARVTGRAQDVGAAPSRDAQSAPRVLAGPAARRLAALVDRLAVAQPMPPEPCPAQLVAQTVTVRFLGAGGRTLASAVEAPYGCGTGVALETGNRRGPELADALGDSLDPALSDELVRVRAFSPCVSGELRALTGRAAPLGATATLPVGLVDRSRAACTVRGFPRVAFTEIGGRTLPLRQVDTDAGALRRAGLSATAVLWPGEAGRSTLSFPSCPRSEVHGLSLTLPDGGTPLTATLAGRSGASPCPHARLTVTALTAGPPPGVAQPAAR